MRRFAAVPLVGVLLGGAVSLGVARLDPDRAGAFGRFGGPQEIPAAFRDDPWYPTYHDELYWWLDVAYDVTRIPRNGDYASRYVNVRDGFRSTWQPPACDCTRLQVWVYGGSTTFGVGQRDDFTIPSQLAKLAWRDGIALEVSNRGTPGDVQWLEGQRFVWDTFQQGRPDLVVFYDGVNEMEAALQRQDQDRGADASLLDSTLEHYKSQQTKPFDLDDVEEPPEGATLVAPPTSPHLGPVDLGRVAVQRYDFGRTLSRRFTADHDIPVEYFWQPAQHSRPIPDGEPRGDEAGIQWSTEWNAAAVSFLPEDVHDLSGALDGIDRPLFFDHMHHNEEAATVIATAMYRVLQPQLRALASAPSVAEVGG